MITGIIQSLQVLDLRVVEWLHSLLGIGAWAAPVVYFFAEQSIFIVPLILLVFVFTHMRTFTDRVKVLIFISFSSLLSLFVVTSFIASVVKRLRPFEYSARIQPLFVEHSFAFPSGHATFFFALAMSLYCHNRAWGIGAFVLAILVSLARVVSGVHYVSVVLAGALIGCGVALLTYRFMVAFFERGQK